MTYRPFDPATMLARPMQAIHASTCPCGRPIAVGNGIALIKGKWRCEECNTIPASYADVSPTTSPESPAIGPRLPADGPRASDPPQPRFARTAHGREES